MNIDYAWLQLDSYDEVVLKKFCETNNDIIFCFWVGGNLSGCHESFQEVIDLISKSIRNNKSYRWGGNSSIVEISSMNTCIYYPMKEERYEYKTVDFLDELKAWKDAEN